MELSVWKELGEKFPLKRAIDCIESAVGTYTKNPSLIAFSSAIEGVHRDAVQSAERAAAVKPWASPAVPTDIIQTLMSRYLAIKAEQAEELKIVEDKYKNWDNSFGDRCALLKNYYEIEKRNAEVAALGKRYQAEAQAREKAELLNKAIDDEVKRLIAGERKT